MDIYLYIYIYIYIYVNVLAYGIQRRLNIAQIEQIELYHLPQKDATACFILRKNLQVTLPNLQSHVKILSQDETGSSDFLR